MASLARSPKKNWIEKLPKAMQTAFEHSIIHRAAVHLVAEEGMAVGHAIATAINWAKHICATGDVKNWPGPQQVRPSSVAECCAAVSLWSAMKAANAASKRTVSSGEISTVGNVPKNAEQRTVDVDVQDISASGKTLTGYAAVYDVDSEDLGGYRERIAPGAFDAVLASDADVRALLNHDENIVLGRTKSGTLRLSSEKRGLRFECDLPESRSDLREAVKRGDIDGASFRFIVGDEDWDGELRTVQSVDKLLDISLATVPAYPAASVELRTRQPQALRSTSSQNGGGLRVRDRTGTLRVTDRNGHGAGRRSLMEEFRSRGFPGETASVPWGEFRASDATIAMGSDVDDLNQSRQTGVPLGADTRYVYTAFPSVPVDSGVTSVEVLRQSARTLASSSDVIRAIDQDDAKPKAKSEIEIVPTSLNQVAATETGIPNVYLESQAVASIVETDLRLSVNAGLDSLVVGALEALSGAGAADPVDPIPDIRAAITTLRAAGYAADTLILTPELDEALDLLVSGVGPGGGQSDYVFGPGNPASSIFSLRRFVSPEVTGAAVADASAFGRLYASPVGLQRFEENDGSTNTSLVRLELHALFGVERADAAVSLTSSSA